jgi:hypothetical protein
MLVIAVCGQPITSALLRRAPADREMGAGEVHEVAAERRRRRLVSRMAGVRMREP